jgi:hypothetical protein
MNKATSFQTNKQTNQLTNKIQNITKITYELS